MRKLLWLIGHKLLRPEAYSAFASSQLCEFISPFEGIDQVLEPDQLAATGVEITSGSSRIMKGTQDVCP